jgi:phage host-nuclease inhibitor protein Gam
VKLTLHTHAEVERAMSELQRLTIAREGYVNKVEQEQAAIAAQYAPLIADLDSDLAVERKALEQYLKDNKSEFDGPPRSLQFASGTIGYRLGMPRLKPLAKTSWDKVLDLLIAGGREVFIRRNLEPNREALLASADDLGEETLKSYGLRKVQDDSPFIEVTRLPEPAKE